MNKSIITIEQAYDTSGTQKIELQHLFGNLYQLESRMHYTNGLVDVNTIHLRPEDLVEVADALKDHLDDEAGKGEDLPCEIAQEG